MNGVEIINQVEIIEKQFGCGFAIGGIIGVILAVVAITFSSLDDNVLIDCVFFIFIIVGTGIIFGGIGATITYEEVPTGKYEYQVTISEDVKMTDFLEKYEIVEQNDKIYTVIEKEI